MVGKEAESKRNNIAHQFVRELPHIQPNDISQLSPSDLEQLFQHYDEAFFSGELLTGFSGKLSFSLSGRLTKSAGKTLAKHNSIEIRLGIEVLARFNETAGAKLVGGVRAANALEALLLVFEHELCHVFEFVRFKSSSCRGQRFKDIAHNLFGHTESYHQLPTSADIAQETLGLKVGDQVTFAYRERELQGVLYRISKRAAVMVHDNTGSYADKQGNRYTKYYVPLEQMKLTNRKEV